MTKEKEALKLTQEPVDYQFRWTNPGNNPHVSPDDLDWKPLEPRTLQTVQQRVEELLAYRYGGVSVYEVRALYSGPYLPLPAQPDAFEQGRQEGIKQERALWTLTKVGQEIEAKPAQEPMAYAGIKMWVGDRQVVQFLTEIEFQHATQPWLHMLMKAEQCLEALREIHA